MSDDELFPVDGSGINALDGFSAFHLAGGAAMGALGFSRGAAYSIIFAVELGELILRGAAIRT